jgi:hypothetical protein
VAGQNRPYGSMYAIGLSPHTIAVPRLRERIIAAIPLCQGWFSAALISRTAVSPRSQSSRAFNGASLAS